MNVRAQSRHSLPDEKADSAGSDPGIHPMAAIFGEADALSSGRIFDAPPKAVAQRAILDQSDPLANARRQEMNGTL